MKALKLSGLLALVIMCSSCKFNDFFDIIFGHHEPQFVYYNLGLSFQDASGHDLVEGIEVSANSDYVKDSLFTLKIIFPEPCNIVNTSGIHYYDLELYSYNGYYYLAPNFNLSVGECPNMKTITYKLKCPYVFGDDTMHEFVTYWDIPPIRNLGANAKCTRIELDGRVITQVTYVEEYMYTSIATIIWEGRKNNK